MNCQRKLTDRFPERELGVQFTALVDIRGLMRRQKRIRPRNISTESKPLVKVLFVFLDGGCAVVTVRIVDAISAMKIDDFSQSHFVPRDECAGAVLQ